MFRRRLVLLVPLGATACSLLPERSYQERRLWPLEVTRAGAPGAATGRVVLVRGLRAGPGMDARGLRRVDAEGAEHLDYWEEWAVPPPQGVEAALRGWLAASGRYAAVVQPGSQAAPDLVVEGELTGFTADVARGQARVALTLVLLARRAGRDVPVLQRGFAGTAPLSGGDAPAAIAALRAATAGVLSEVEAAFAAVSV